MGEMALEVMARDGDFQILLLKISSPVMA